MTSSKTAYQWAAEGVAPGTIPSYQEFSEAYDTNSGADGWFGRKVFAIPNLVISLTIKPAYHIASALFTLVCSVYKAVLHSDEVKKAFNTVDQDLFAAWGYLRMLVNDRCGQYWIGVTDQQKLMNSGGAMPPRATSSLNRGVGHKRSYSESHVAIMVKQRRDVKPDDLRPPPPPPPPPPLPLTTRLVRTSSTSDLKKLKKGWKPAPREKIKGFVISQEALQERIKKMRERRGSQVVRGTRPPKEGKLSNEEIIRRALLEKFRSMRVPKEVTSPSLGHFTDDNEYGGAPKKDRCERRSNLHDGSLSPYRPSVGGGATGGGREDWEDQSPPSSPDPSRQVRRNLFDNSSDDE